MFASIFNESWQLSKYANCPFEIINNLPKRTLHYHFFFSYHHHHHQYEATNALNFPTGQIQSSQRLLFFRKKDEKKKE